VAYVLEVSIMIMIMVFGTNCQQQQIEKIYLIKGVTSGDLTDMQYALYEASAPTNCSAPGAIVNNRFVLLVLPWLGIQ
jgi:hypothetical protein